MLFQKSKYSCFLGLIMMQRFSVFLASFFQGFRKKALLKNVRKLEGIHPLWIPIFSKIAEPGLEFYLKVGLYCRCFLVKFAMFF